MKIIVKMASKLLLLIGCILPAFTHTTAMKDEAQRMGKYNTLVMRTVEDRSVDAEIYSCNGENVFPCNNPAVVEDNQIAQGRILWSSLPYFPVTYTFRIPSFSEKMGLKFTPTANYFSATYDRNEYMNGLAGKEIKIIMVSSPGTNDQEKGIVTFYRQLPNETSWTEVGKVVVLASTPAALTNIMLQAKIESNGTASFTNLMNGQTAKVFLGKRNFLNK